MTYTCGLYSRSVKYPRAHQRFCKYTHCLVSEKHDKEKHSKAVEHCIYLKGDLK